MQPLYTTHATATGGRTGTAHSADGRLNITLTHPVVQPRPAEGTDPEQLFGAGYAACYAGACAFAAKQLEIALPEAPKVEATVTLLKREDGGFSVQVALAATFDGLSATDATKVAAKGHTICPYSYVLREGVVVSTTANGEAI